MPAPSRRRRARTALAGAGGAVTAEAAVMLGVLVLTTALLVGVIQVVDARLRCVDAAREAARAAARSEPESTVRGIAAAAAPPGSTVTVRVADGQVVATVTATVRLAGVGHPTVTVTSTSVALLEERSP